MAKQFKKLTRPAMRSLAPGQSLTEHCIKFQREQSGDGVFSVNIMVDRRRVHRVIGRESEGVTRRQAEEFIARARTDARRNRLDLPHGRKTPLPFRQAANQYIERLEQEAGRNIRTKRRQLAQHLTPYFGDLPLSQISGSDIERYKHDRVRAGAAPSTVNRELAVLSHILNKCVEWGSLQSPPAKIRRFPERNARVNYLTENQCAALLEAAARDQNENVHAFIMVGLHTGMRHSEILKIRIADISVERQVIWIPEAKAGQRQQPITADLAEYLERRIKMLPNGSSWLFPSIASRSGHVHTIRKAFRRSVKRAGLDPNETTPHTLRHSFVTHLVQAGVDLPTVRRLSGHKTMIMVERYAHQNGAHIADAMTILQNRYGAVAGGQAVEVMQEGGSAPENGKRHGT